MKKKYLTYQNTPFIFNCNNQSFFNKCINYEVIPLDNNSKDFNVKLTDEILKVRLE